MKNKIAAYAHQLANQQPALTFEILSDLHITLPIPHKKLDHALDDIWQRKVRTVVVLGDLCSHGLMMQLQQCLKQLKEYPNRYLIALGNHDTYSMKDHHQIHIHHLYKELILQHHHHLYYDEMVDGFHFYVLNSEQPCKDTAYYSTQQLFWLHEKLQKDDPHKPVFVLCHHPLKNSHLHSDESKLSSGFQHTQLHRVLKMHPHVVFISGHIHNSYEQCHIRCDSTLFEIDVPSFAQTQFGHKKEEIGYQIQVYHDFLYLRTRDYKHQRWILSHEYILDITTHQFLSFDDSLVPIRR